MKHQEVLEKYLLQTKFTNCNSLLEASVYGPNAVPAWALARDVSCTATVDANSGIMKFDRTQPRNKYNDIDIDLNRVIMRSVTLKYAKNTTKDKVVVRLAHTPIHYKEGQDQLDQIAKTVSKDIPIGFAAIDAGANEPRQDIAMCEIPEIMPTQKAFIHTMTLINESNIWNGIIHIPPEVCKAAGLDMRPTVKQYTGEKTKFQFESYYAVPPDHILSWPYHLTHHQRLRYGVHAIDFVILGTDRRMFYLVGDECFNMIFNDCWKNWNPESTVEVRPLNEFNVTFHKVTQKSGPNEGNVELTLNVTYTGFPQNIPQDVLNSLAPVLDNNFPPFIYSRRCIAIRDYDLAQMDKKRLEEEAAKRTE